MHHVLVRPLHHHLVLVSVLDPVEGALSRLKAIRLAHDVVFDAVLLQLGLLKLSLSTETGRLSYVLGVRAIRLPF